MHSDPTVTCIQNNIAHLSPAARLRAIYLDDMQGDVVTEAVDDRGAHPGHQSTTSVRGPEPGPGQVQVRIQTAGINPADWKRGSKAAWRVDLEHVTFLPECYVQ